MWHLTLHSVLSSLSSPAVTLELRLLELTVDVLPLLFEEVNLFGHESQLFLQTQFTFLHDQLLLWVIEPFHQTTRADIVVFQISLASFKIFNLRVWVIAHAEQLLFPGVDSALPFHLTLDYFFVLILLLSDCVEIRFCVAFHGQFVKGGFWYFFDGTVDGWGCFD